MRTVGPLLVATLLVGLLLPSGVLAQSPSAPTDPGATASRWTPATDVDGRPLAVGPVTPIALEANGDAVLAVVVDATGAARTWSTADGMTWTVSDPATFAGRRVDGVATTLDRWIAWSLPADPDEAPLAMWTSRTSDLSTWTPVPPEALAPFAGARLSDVVGASDGFIALGTRGAGRRQEVRTWTSPYGGDWRARPQFAAEHPGADLVALQPMGRALVGTGTEADGSVAAWFGWGYLRYSWRMTPGSTPPDGTPGQLVVGRDAGLLLARRADGTLDPWRSIDAWTWSPTDGPPDLDPTGERTAWAGNGTWVIADTVGTDGTHDLQASTDGLTWTAISSTGLPADGAVPQLAVTTDGIAALTPVGLWTRPLDLDLPPLPAGAGTRFDGPAPGADPPLRPPVTARWRDRERLVVSGSPDATRTKDGVTLELWLPDRAFRPGEWLPAHIRFTNRGPGSIVVGCDPGGVSGNVSGFWPSGRTWSGNAAIFKRRVLKANALESVWFRPASSGGLPCPGGDVGLDYTIAPGESYGRDLFALPASTIGDQPLPSGRMPVRAFLSWRTADDAGRRRIIAAVGSVRLQGPDWPWPSPGQVVDAALEDPFFGDWIARQSPPLHWSNTTFTTSQHWIYTQPVGYEGAAPDGIVHLGLFAGSWSPAVGGYGQVLLDPWTATVLGSGAEE